MSSASRERVLRRDRLLIVLAVAALAALAWMHVLWLAGDMNMAGMDMTGFRMIPAGIAMMAPTMAPWSAFEFIIVFLMWSVMMVGMMLPSVTPMLLIQARVARRATEQKQPFAATAWFAAGYLAAWIAFALAATLAQWALERASLLTSEMQIARNVAGAIILTLIGAYQWTPAKDTCLAYCQSPLFFIQRHGGFGRDAAAALRLGALHGAYCVGCCWALMALLFVAGVMNVTWIAAITNFILAEKLIPAGRLLSRAAGLGCLAVGLWWLASGLR
jgi:predicted metal-binding membrane protein